MASSASSASSSSSSASSSSPSRRRPGMSSYLTIASLALLLAAAAPLATRAHPSLNADLISRQQQQQHLNRRQSASQITSANSTAQVAALCDCGFIDLTEGADPTQVWTSLWKADFANMRSKDLGNGFRFMRNEIQRANSDMSRAFDPGNAGLCNGGLCLTVEPASKNKIPSAGVYTKDTNLHFGNYYAEVKIPATVGTVSAFYIYKSDINEVDMEYNNPTGAANASIKDTVKPQIYTGTLADPATYKKTYAPPGVDMTQDFHTWSFQWSPTQVAYGLDGDFANVITVNVPQQPGVLSFSHWSDGNPSYSGGPPVESTVLTFRRAWAFWNDSTLPPLPCKLSTAPCKLDARIPTGSTDDAISSARRMKQAVGAVPLLSLVLVTATFLALA